MARFGLVRRDAPCSLLVLSQAGRLLTDEFNLRANEISVRDIRRNLSPSTLYEEAIRHEPGIAISDTGALIAL